MNITETHHATAKSDEFTPLFPESIDELDVSADFLSDLAIKAVSLEAEATSAGIAKKLCLGMLIVEELLQGLVREKLIECTGLVSLYNHRYRMLDHGWHQVDRLMNACPYIGPAPVSLTSYTEMMTGQVGCRPRVRREALDHAMRDLVLSDATQQTLQLVASSGRSLFLSGPPGNGKTAMARALVEAIPGHLWIPYALEVDGQVIRVFDAHCHVPLETPTDKHDHRWIMIRPPLVVVGGDLTLENLELAGMKSQRFYDAPFQVKANGGVLVVDDLGRQRCSAGEVLNRWIIPLEYRMDYLTLSTGKKIAVPFEAVVVFATNLTGGDLEDEAFLRRMGYRLSVTPPSDETYTEIFSQCAQANELPADPALVAGLLESYRRTGRTPKCCDPRDLIERAHDLCRTQGEPFHLDSEILQIAWSSYFGDAEPSDKLAGELGQSPTRQPDIHRIV